MFDGDLVFDKLNSLHHQAQNLLFRFKARVIERGADITTKLLDCRCQRRLSMLFLLQLSERIYIRFQTPAFSCDSFTSLFEITQFDHA
jgi:hypothetical protein